jgi:hypothetical protein
MPLGIYTREADLVSKSCDFGFTNPRPRSIGDVAKSPVVVHDCNQLSSTVKPFVGCSGSEVDVAFLVAERPLLEGPDKNIFPMPMEGLLP